MLKHCDAVILAGGRASRMGGCNKLLQCFDGQQRQLEKLCHHLKPQVQRLWINSHRDNEVYQAFDRSIGIFHDIEQGHLGAMMGMMSAWLYSRQDWILFVPCDLYQVPNQLLFHFAQQMTDEKTQVCYAEINDVALYPLCLMHRSASTILAQEISAQQRSLYRCFKKLNSCAAKFQLNPQCPHSINSWSELAAI